MYFTLSSGKVNGGIDIKRWRFVLCYTMIRKQKGGDLIMDSKAIDKIASDAKLEISHQIDKFIAELQDGTNDPDNFITITQLEEKLSLLRANTTKTYSDILSAYLESMDETELIKRKKGNTEIRG